MFDELYPQERDTSLGQSIQRPDPIPESPSFFDGSGGAIADILPNIYYNSRSVFTEANDAYHRAWEQSDNASMKPPPSSAELKHAIIDPIGTNEVAKSYREEAKKYTPDPQSVGFAGQLIHGVGTSLVKAGVYSLTGLAAPALFGADMAANETLKLRDEGVDINTALEAGAVSGVANAAGFMIAPALGATRAASAAWGAGSNIALNVAEIAGIHTLLNHANYKSIAAQYQPLDPTNIIVSGLLGSAFGAAFHKGKVDPVLTPDEHAAALTMNEAYTRNNDTLTHPDDVNSLSAATDAQALARQQLDGGEMVSVADGINIDHATVKDRIASISDDLMSIAGNRMTRGERLLLEQQKSDLEYKLKQIEDSDYTQQGLDSAAEHQALLDADNAGRLATTGHREPARKLADQRKAMQESATALGEAVRQEDMQPHHDSLSRLNEMLVKDDEARAAHSEISRLEQQHLLDNGFIQHPEVKPLYEAIKPINQAPTQTLHALVEQPVKVEADASVDGELFNNKKGNHPNLLTALAQHVLNAIPDGWKLKNGLRGRVFIAETPNGEVYTDGNTIIPGLPNAAKTKEGVKSAVNTLGDKYNSVKSLDQQIMKDLPDMDSKVDEYWEPYSASLTFALNLTHLKNTTKPVNLNVSSAYEPIKHALYHGIKDNKTVTLADGKKTSFRDAYLQGIKTLKPIGVEAIDKFTEGLEKSLKKSKERVQNAIASAPDVVALLAKNNVILHDLEDNAMLALAKKSAESGRRVGLIDDSNYALLKGENPKDVYATNLSPEQQALWDSTGNTHPFDPRDPAYLIAQKKPVYDAVAKNGAIISTNHYSEPLINFLRNYSPKLYGFKQFSQWTQDHQFGFISPNRPEYLSIIGHAGESNVKNFNLSRDGRLGNRRTDAGILSASGERGYKPAGDRLPGKSSGDNGISGRRESAGNLLSAAESGRAKQGHDTGRTTGSQPAGRQENNLSSQSVESPEITSAREALSSMDASRQIEIPNDDGTVDTGTASELMARADEDMAFAEQSDAATTSAISCFLKFGGL